MKINSLPEWRLKERFHQVLHHDLQLDFSKRVRMPRRPKSNPAQLGWFIAVVFVSRFVYRTLEPKMPWWLMAGLFLVKIEYLFGCVSVECLFCASCCSQVRGTVVLAYWLWTRLLNAGQNCIRVSEWSSYEKGFGWFCGERSPSDNGQWSRPYTEVIPGMDLLSIQNTALKIITSEASLLKAM